MQKPSIGRVVHVCHSGLRYAATITYVHSDTCVNVGGFDHNGYPFQKTSCLFEQENVTPEDAVARPNHINIQHNNWTWPPRV